MDFLCRVISHVNFLTCVNNIQLFRETLSEKVHATFPKGIVGGFEFTLLQRNLKKSHERPRTYL